jgi:GR25 family glycosyltransferase involved in LPS biosynthesis
MGTFSLANLDTYWINLESRPDRRKLMEAELANAGLTDARRFSAMTREEWREPIERAPRIAPFRTAGNWLSFCHLFRTIQDTDRQAMILEDDIFLARDIGKRLQYLEDAMTLPYDVIFLGATFHLKRNAPNGLWHPEIGRDVELTPIKHVLRAYGVWSNHGMIINGKSAGKILALMRSVMHEARGSDHALILVQPQLDAYVFVPGCVMQHDGVSDVAESGGTTVFSNFLKMGPYVYQDWLSNWNPDEFDWAEAGIER